MEAEKFPSPPPRQDVVSICAENVMLPAWCSHISPSGKPSSHPLVCWNLHSGFNLPSSLAVCSVIIFSGSKKPGVGNLAIQLMVSSSLGSNFSPYNFNKPFARINQQSSAPKSQLMCVFNSWLFSPSLILWGILSLASFSGGSMEICCWRETLPMPATAGHATKELEQHKWQV